LSTKSDLSVEQAISLIDMTNVDMEYKVSIIDRPILTASGKMPLKVN